jgi:2-iminobutanoate/2-iminopropanoate deaminase
MTIEARRHEPAGFFHGAGMTAFDRGREPRCQDFDSRRSIRGEDAVGWRSHASGNDAAAIGKNMKQVIRVEPLSTYLERWKAPTSAVIRHGDTIYVSGFPPFDPQTGEIVDAPIERQTELVLEQLKLCVETAGSSLQNVLKCNVYCTAVDKFASVNAVYARYFPNDPPARIFVNVPAWPGHFDIEIDCVAAVL